MGNNTILRNAVEQAGGGNTKPVDELARLIKSMVELDRLKGVESRLSYHLVLSYENGHVDCHQYDELQSLTTCLSKLVGTQAQAFVFYGERWGITRGPFKYLVPVKGDRVPLFQTPEQIELDPEGNMSVDQDVEDVIKSDAQP